MPQCKPLVALFVALTILLNPIVLPRNSTANASIINPIDDIIWQESFPMAIACWTIRTGNTYDTPVIGCTPVCVCPFVCPPCVRVGFPIKFWEVARMIEVVQEPWYFPFIDTELNPGFFSTNAGVSVAGMNPGAGPMYKSSSFAQVHYMAMPFWTIMEVIVDLLCLEFSGFDMLYLSEVDPLWVDDLLSLWIHPESLLFQNPIVQLVCIVDSLMSCPSLLVLDPLFWCIGCSGNSYPLTGHISDDKVVQASHGIGARMIYKLSRQFLICDVGIALCSCVPVPIWKKSNYKYHSSRPSRGFAARPIGTMSIMQGPVNPPLRGGKGQSDEFLWMLFRHHVCCVW